MRVLIGMETSGQIRNRVRAAGHEAVSCDLLPSKDGSPYHHTGDVFALLRLCHANGWWPDAAVFHPECTYLTGSAAWAFGDGPYHQQVKPGTIVGQARRDKREEAVSLVRTITKLPIKTIVIENPVGHLSSAIGKPTQIVQPYEFGDDASKKTCLWIYQDGELLTKRQWLPIDPAKRCAGRIVVYNGREVERWSNQTDSGQNALSPDDDRWQVRSETFSGIADAITAKLIGGSP